MSAVAIVAGETALFAGRSVRRFFRTKRLVIAGLAFPVLMLFVLVAAFSEVVEARIGGEYIDRLGPLVVLTTATFASAGSAASFHDDLRSGLLNRLRSMPIYVGSLLAGRALGDLTRILINAGVATAAAYVLGFRFSQGVPAALAFFGVVVLFGTMVTWVALLVALVADTLEGIERLLGTPTTFLFFMSSGFVPLDAFPGLVQPFVRVNPMSVVNDALIGLSSGGPVARPLLGTIAWAVGVSVVCAVVAAKRFRSLTRRDAVHA